MNHKDPGMCQLEERCPLFPFTENGYHINHMHMVGEYRHYLWVAYQPIGELDGKSQGVVLMVECAKSDYDIHSGLVLGLRKYRTFFVIARYVSVLAFVDIVHRIDHCGDIWN